MSDTTRLDTNNTAVRLARLVPGGVSDIRLLFESGFPLEEILDVVPGERAALAREVRRDLATRLPNAQ